MLMSAREELLNVTDIEYTKRASSLVPIPNHYHTKSSAFLFFVCY
jgi:hypothetical protein